MIDKSILARKEEIIMRKVEQEKAKFYADSMPQIKRFNAKLFNNEARILSFDECNKITSIKYSKHCASYAGIEELDFSKRALLNDICDYLSKQQIEYFYIMCKVGGFGYYGIGDCLGIFLEIEDLRKLDFTKFDLRFWEEWGRFWVLFWLNGELCSLDVEFVVEMLCDSRTSKIVRKNIEVYLDLPQITIKDMISKLDYIPFFIPPNRPLQ